MENLTTLRDLTLKWSDDRGILKNGKTTTQALKLVSEVGELCDNVAKGRNIKDDIGDCLVVLTNIAALEGLTLEQCWSHAYNEIKDRKGYLNEHGNFIKEGDIDRGSILKAIRIEPLLFLNQFELYCLLTDGSIKVVTFIGRLDDNMSSTLRKFTDGSQTLDQFKTYMATLGDVR